MFEKGLVVTIGLIVALYFALITLIIAEKNEWDRYRVVHQCKKVAQISGEVFNTFGTSTSGQMTVGVGTTSDKTGWLCDDGVTYYR